MHTYMVGGLEEYKNFNKFYRWYSKSHAKVWRANKGTLCKQICRANDNLTYMVFNHIALVGKRLIAHVGVNASKSGMELLAHQP